MSGNSKKSSQRSSARTKDQTTAWSEWLWSTERGQWYSYRLNTRGEYQYQYQEPEAQQVPGSGTAQDNPNNSAYVPATTSGQSPVVDEYQTTPTLVPTETSYPHTHYGSVPTPAVNSYDESVSGSVYASVSKTEGDRNNQPYYPVPNDERYKDNYQFHQTSSQLAVKENDSEDSEDSYDEVDPKPDPSKPPCDAQQACVDGPHRNKNGPHPRPPPTGYASRNTSNNQARGSRNTRNSTHKGSSSSKGRTRAHNGTDGTVITGETEFDFEKEKEFSVWEKEYNTWKDVTCACGFGYYTILGEWISGADVRKGLAPPRPQQDTVEL